MKGQGGRVAKETLEELEANTTAKGREQGPRSKDEKILLPMEGCEQDRLIPAIGKRRFSDHAFGR